MRLMPGGEARARLYSPRVQREPLDQTDLSNSLDASSKAVGDRHMKLVDRWA